MNYIRHYDLLMERANNRVLYNYYEKHHIIPRALGGLNDAANIAYLTPEEHYVAHQLLVKIYPANTGLLAAAFLMTTGWPGRRSNKVYGWLRKRFSESMRGGNNPNVKDPTIQKRAGLKRVGQKRTTETRSRMSNAQKGRTFSDETKQKMRLAAQKRSPISELTREKLRNRLPNSPWLGKSMTEETKKKMSESQTGRKHSYETKKKMSESAKNRKLQKQEN